MLKVSKQLDAISRNEDALNQQREIDGIVAELNAHPENIKKCKLYLKGALFEPTADSDDDWNAGEFKDIKYTRNIRATYLLKSIPFADAHVNFGILKSLKRKENMALHRHSQ